MRIDCNLSSIVVSADLELLFEAIVEIDGWRTDKQLMKKKAQLERFVLGWA